MAGGDWGKDRLVPDCIRAFLKNETIHLRNPRSIRPWRHLLEPLSGYLVLAQRLAEGGAEFADAWNFGPEDRDARNVEWVVARLCEKWGNRSGYTVDEGEHPHEATYLKLDCSKAGTYLNWHPRWNLDTALDAIIEWTVAYRDGMDIRQVCLRQIEAYERDDQAEGLTDLLTLGVRVATLIQYVARRSLESSGDTLTGLYPGNPKRATSTPTCERLLQSFSKINLTIIETGDSVVQHITPLSHLQVNILELLGMDAIIYGDIPKLAKPLRC